MKPPYLSRVSWRQGAEVDRSAYPFHLSLFAGDDFELSFARPVTIIVGENGSGKSTLLEVIAAHCGFNLTGGNRNHHHDQHDDVSDLSRALRFGWRLKTGDGFFMRADGLQKFGDSLDEMAEGDGPAAYAAYGGKSLNAQSHGEGFLAVLENRFKREGVYILDEPEAALSPMRQLRLLTLLDQVEKAGNAQIIMATHSPILMSFPRADLLEIKDDALVPTEYRNTAHFRMMARFVSDPEEFHRRLFAEIDV